MKTTMGTVACVLLGVTGPAFATIDGKKATAIVRDSVTKALEVLEDPALQGKAKRRERHAKLRSLSDEVFNWRAMSQRSLGIHWRELSEPQRTRFVDTFEELLANHYLRQIDQFSGKETVRYVATEGTVDGAVVKMKIVTRSREEVPLDFLMGEGHRVFDVSIEGVSIANHYRGSFDRLLVNGDFESMMKRLERKVAAKRRRLEADSKPSAKP